MATGSTRESAKPTKQPKADGEDSAGVFCAPRCPTISTYPIRPHYLAVGHEAVPIHRYLCSRQVGTGGTSGEEFISQNLFRIASPLSSCKIWTFYGKPFVFVQFSFCSFFFSRGIFSNGSKCSLFSYRRPRCYTANSCLHLLQLTATWGSSFHCFIRSHLDYLSHCVLTSSLFMLIES